MIFKFSYTIHCQYNVTYIVVIYLFTCLSPTLVGGRNEHFPRLSHRKHTHTRSPNMPLLNEKWLNGRSEDNSMSCTHLLLLPEGGDGVGSGSSRCVGWSVKNIWRRRWRRENNNKTQDDGEIQQKKNVFFLSVEIIAFGRGNTHIDT